MSNPMKYIRDLEAAGFERAQAEAQVQVVLDALEGDLVTKADFALYQEKMDNNFVKFQERIENKLTQHQQQMQLQIKESEFRMVTRLGIALATSTTLTISVLAWLIKV